MSPPGLYRDIPCAIKTPGEPRCWAGRAPVKNGGAPFRTGSDTGWHGMSGLSPVCIRKMAVLYSWVAVEPRFVPV